MSGAPDLSLQHERYPRASKYDPTWVHENAMGPNVLWLAEWLSEAMDLRPGMRLLDMGCGRALSSIFFAKEFGVEVWATDLWIKPTENWQRIREAGLEGKVCPIYAEAHQLPFAHHFFDAAVSLDAYHYFGTSDLYLSSFARFVKPGGQIGIVVPGLTAEFDELPSHSSPTGTTTTTPSTAPAGGGATGNAAVRSMSKSPICSPTAGATGSAGRKSAPRRTTRPARAGDAAYRRRPHPRLHARRRPREIASRGAMHGTNHSPD